jgi:hypothetical protein
VPKETLDALAAFKVELVLCKHATDVMDHGGLFWRFYVLSDPDVVRFIVRDPDSRLTVRDRECVTEWINSKELFHVIRDHPHHGIPIMGAMWGSVNGFISPELIEAYKEQKKATPFNEDQLFLREMVWPHVRDYTLAHDVYFCAKEELKSKLMRPIPVKRLALNDFIGNPLRPDNEYKGLDIAEECPAICRKDPSWNYC